MASGTKRPCSGAPDEVVAESRRDETSVCFLDRARANEEALYYARTGLKTAPASHRIEGLLS